MPGSLAPGEPGDHRCFTGVLRVSNGSNAGRLSAVKQRPGGSGGHLPATCLGARSPGAFTRLLQMEKASAWFRRATSTPLKCSTSAPIPVIIVFTLVQHAGFPGHGGQSQEAFRRAALAGLVKWSEAPA